MGVRKTSRVARPDASAVTTVIFDADDTLWDTQPLYETSKAHFFRLMHKLGFPRDDVAARLEAIDHLNVAKLRFSQERFPRSMYETYHSLCAAHERSFDETIAKRILKIGSAVFESAPPVFDGVEETLSVLRSNSVRLMLATKGDRAVQELRVSVSGLGPYFNSVHIWQDKGVDEFMRLISGEHISLLRGWSVGNSARSDINPALAAGLQAIWIPRRTWSYEDEPTGSDERLHIAKSITEVPSIVLRGL